jgi:hypothetical protein
VASNDSGEDDDYSDENIFEPAKDNLSPVEAKPQKISAKSSVNSNMQSMFVSTIEDGI